MSVIIDISNNHLIPWLDSNFVWTIKNNNFIVFCLQQQCPNCGVFIKNTFETRNSLNHILYSTERKMYKWLNMSEIW